MNSDFNRQGILQKLGIPHHEYWSWWFFSIVTWPWWIWYAIRLRNSTWFTAVNPGIEHSGFTEESKIKILKKIPSKYLPNTLFINYSSSLPSIPFSFPYIAKPDIGGRGRKIETIHSLDELQKYHASIGENYMLQDIVESKFEFGVFFAKIPSEKHGRIISITGKKFLSVVGRNNTSILELMKESKRAAPQINRLSKYIDLNEILPDGVERILEPIGNHCRGTAFINRNDLINEKIELVFDEIARSIDGFYYGRFDLKVTSIEDFYKGDGISILELNGLTSMDTHIFDPSFRLRDVFPILIKNCTLCFNIAKENIQLGESTSPLHIILKKSLAFFNE